MGKFIFLLWLSLVGYTVIYGIFFGLNSLLLPTLIAGEADYFSGSFFNLMGLIPVMFFLDYLTYYPLNHKKIWAFLLSLFLGGFILIPAYRDFKDERKPSFTRAILATMIFVSIAWVMISAFMKGNPSVYFSQFFEDSLVGIMTVDWFAIYILTVIISFHRHPKKGWISLMPILGFASLLVFDNLRKPRH